MRRCPAQARGCAGFTLIEAAIVLVVIGLILGVVLQGQSLIRNAEYRSLKSDISDYQSGFYAFRDRYNRLPGDMPGTKCNHGYSMVWMGRLAPMPATASSMMARNAAMRVTRAAWHGSICAGRA